MEIKINGKGVIAALILSAGFVSAEYVSVIDSNSVKYTSAPEATFDSPIEPVVMWGSVIPPAGWFEMNGQSTSGYPELTTIYGATLPDLRVVKTANETRPTNISLMYIVKAE